MARIKYGPIIADISGSIGSATFQKSLYGNTLRNRPRNTRTGTAAQLVARSIMMQCQYAWRSLDSATRKQWDQYIAFSGAHIKRDSAVLMTGHSLFLKWNYARLQAGLSIITAIVYKSTPAWPYLQYVTITSTVVRLFFSDNLATLNILPKFLVSPRRQPSQAFSMQGLRMLQNGVVEGSSYYFDGSYIEIFGSQMTLTDTYHSIIQFISTESPLISSIQTNSFIPIVA